MESDPYHPLHAVHGFVLAQPDCLASVRVLFDFVIHWHERRGTVMLWPVKLDAARDPRPQQTNQRGLNYVLPVEKIIVVGLVLPNVDTSTDFR